MPDMTLARIWRGRTRPEVADDYEAYIRAAGIPPLQDTALGVQLLREDLPGETWFTVISYWPGMEAMRRFTHGEPTSVRHLPRDAELLLEHPGASRSTASCWTATPVVDGGRFDAPFRPSRGARAPGSPCHRRVPLKSFAFALAALLGLPSAAHADFHLRSADIPAGGAMPESLVLDGFGCKGGNRSPALSWSGAPKETRSFAVTIFDRDAPTGSGWWHWVVFNLPAGTDHLATDASRAGLPAGAVQGLTDFGKAGYGGPCPPAGAKPHRYVVTVHALKVESLPLDAAASGAMVGFMIGQNAIARARFTATYGR